MSVWHVFAARRRCIRIRASKAETEDVVPELPLLPASFTEQRLFKVRRRTEGPREASLPLSVPRDGNDPPTWRRRILFSGPHK